MAEVPWDQDVTTDDTTPVSEWNAFKDRVISIAGDKSIGDGFTLLKADTKANRPSAAYAGRLYYATDEGIWYRDNGSSWIELVRGEGQIRLAQLSEKSYTSLNDVPSTFTPESHGNTAHTSNYSSTPVADVESAGLSMAANVNPDSDNARQLGQSGTRWSSIYAVDIYGTVHYNDLAFTEKRCEVCGEKFVEGDKVSLIVNEMKEDGTYLVPKHEGC